MVADLGEVRKVNKLTWGKVDSVPSNRKLIKGARGFKDAMKSLIKSADQRVYVEVQHSEKEAAEWMAKAKNNEIIKAQVSPEKSSYVPSPRTSPLKSRPDNADEDSTGMLNISKPYKIDNTQ